MRKIITLSIFCIFFILISKGECKGLNLNSAISNYISSNLNFDISNIFNLGSNDLNFIKQLLSGNPLNAVKNYIDACSNPATMWFPSSYSNMFYVCFPAPSSTNCAFYNILKGNYNQIFKYSYGNCIYLDMNKNKLLSLLKDSDYKTSGILEKYVKGKVKGILKKEEEKIVKRMIRKNPASESAKGLIVSFDKKTQEEIDNEKTSMIDTLKLSEYSASKDKDDKYKFNEDFYNYKETIHYNAFNNFEIVKDENFVKKLDDVERGKYSYFLYKQMMVEASIKGFIKELGSLETELKAMEKMIDEVCNYNANFEIKPFTFKSEGNNNLVENIESNLNLNAIANSGALGSITGGSIFGGSCCLCAPAINSVREAVVKGSQDIIKEIAKSSKNIIDELEKVKNKLIKEKIAETNYKKEVLKGIYMDKLAFQKQAYCTSLKINYLKLKMKSLEIKLSLYNLLSTESNVLKQDYEKLKREVLSKETMGLENVK